MHWNRGREPLVKILSKKDKKLDNKEVFSAWFEFLWETLKQREPFFKVKFTQDQIFCRTLQSEESL